MTNRNYVAIVLISSTSDSTEYQTLYDETTLLNEIPRRKRTGYRTPNIFVTTLTPQGAGNVPLAIQATSKEEATSKAVQYGRSCEGSYTSAGGFHIVKKFMGVEDVNDILEDLGGDVTAVNSRFFHDLDAYKKFGAMLNSEE